MLTETEGPITWTYEKQGFSTLITGSKQYPAHSHSQSMLVDAYDDMEQAKEKIRKLLGLRQINASR